MLNNIFFIMDILFIDEIAKELRVGRSSVYTMLNEGLREHMLRIGKRQAILRKDLYNYIESKKGK